MLNGIDPIIIFNFSKLEPDLQAAVSDIPILQKIVNKVGLPPIPVYLSEKLTGLYIDSEEKSIDIETVPETLADGEEPVLNQKGLNSTIRVNLVASRNSIGMTLLSALADRIFEKVTSKEYSITYLHLGVTIFNGLLKSFSLTQNSENDLYNISFELTAGVVKTQDKPGIPRPERQTGAVPL